MLHDSSIATLYLRNHDYFISINILSKFCLVRWKQYMVKMQFLDYDEGPYFIIRIYFFHDFLKKYVSDWTKLSENVHVAAKSNFEMHF